MPNQRKPDNLHLLHGTYRADRHGPRGSAPTLTPGAPKCPAWLSRDAKAEWRRITEILEPAGVLTEADMAILAVYCQLFGEFKANSAGFTAAKLTQLRLCMAELGLSPVSRGKVKPVASRAPNPFDDL